MLARPFPVEKFDNMTINKQDGPVVGEGELSSLQQDGKLVDGAEDAAALPVVETPSIVNDQSEPRSAEQPQELLNVPEGSPAPDGKSSSGHGGQRSTSSKFASLRATFEQSAPADDNSNMMRRRLPSHDKAIEITGDQREGYESEIARLKDEVEKEKELRITFEEKITGLEEEVDGLNGQLEQRDEQWRMEFEKRSAELIEAAEGRLDMMASEARSREEEALNLQKQLSDLKQGIATSTRSGLQVSDTTFKQEFDVLQHEVQNWVVNNFRRIKIEASAEDMCSRLDKVAEARHLKHLKPLYGQYDPGAKIPILQATVAAYMLEIFEEPYLYGLQGQGDLGKRAKQAADTLLTVLDRETYHRWRAMTFDAIRSSESINEPVDSAATGVAEMICVALKALTDAEDTENRQPSLKPIILRAISVAHLIRVQQSTYEFLLPYPGDAFDQDTMESIVEDLDDDDNRIVRCATFPSIAKTNDVAGGGPNPGGVIAKAKVLCGEDRAKDP